MKKHMPVLLQSVFDGLAIKSDGCYVDGTFGRGGHAAVLLEALSDKGRLIAFDKDPEALAVAEQLAENDPRVTVVSGSFAQLQTALTQLELLEKIDGVLLDLGVSSPQLDDAGRGFSFMRDGPLDMRMDPRVGMDAATWLNTAPVEELAAVFKDCGEERYARRIAKAIVYDREETPFQTTRQLAGMIERVSPTKDRHKHPATRVFQAIRIFVNRELDDLHAVLPQCLSVLKVGGRLVVISFHSLEDRIVKQFIEKKSKAHELPAGVPVTADYGQASLHKVARIKPSEQDIEDNVRARSAVLRIAEKLA